MSWSAGQICSLPCSVLREPGLSDLYVPGSLTLWFAVGISHWGKVWGGWRLEDWKWQLKHFLPLPLLPGTVLTVATFFRGPSSCWAASFPGCRSHQALVTLVPPLRRCKDGNGFLPLLVAGFSTRIMDPGEFHHWNWFQNLSTTCWLFPARILTQVGANYLPERSRNSKESIWTSIWFIVLLLSTSWNEMIRLVLPLNHLTR